MLDLFRRGDTAGIFQFESGGMRKLLLDMQPDRLEDLIAANALFRPGPMDLIPEYCLRKHGKQPVPQVHPIVDEYTAETYGIMIYQEQVMQIVHGLGDIPLRQAYTLIKAISKKKHAVIDSVRPKFVEGAGAKGLSAANAKELFDLILKFAGYGFNKSHSTGYAIIAYQTAYLKTYFPAQYMAAVLTYESGAKKIEDWAPYLEDCRHTRWPDHQPEPEPAHIGVEVKPPDLNLSAARFSVVFAEEELRDNLHGHIRFGLGAIKGVGKAAIGVILEERDEHGPFESLFDLCERVPSRVVNKATIEALAKSGALDSLHGAEHRSAVFAAVDDAISAGQRTAEDRRAGQMSIFGLVEETTQDEAAAPAARPLPSVPAWDQMTRLAGEKETLGIHVSGHPLDPHEDLLRTYCTADTRAMNELHHDAGVVLGGVLNRVRITVVKSGRSAGEKMAMITLQDRLGVIDGVVFSTVFARDAHRLQDSAIVLVVGRVDTSRGGVQVIVDQVLSVEDAPMHLAQAITVTFQAKAEGAPVTGQMEMVRGVLQQAGALRGRAVSEASGRAVEVRICLETSGKRVSMRPQLPPVIAEPLLLQRLASIVGEDHVHVIGGAVPVKRREPRRQRGQPREAVSV